MIDITIFYQCFQSTYGTNSIPPFFNIMISNERLNNINNYIHFESIVLPQIRTHIIQLPINRTNLENKVYKSLALIALNFYRIESKTHSPLNPYKMSMIFQKKALKMPVKPAKGVKNVHCTCTSTYVEYSFIRR